MEWRTHLRALKTLLAWLSVPARGWAVRGAKLTLQLTFSGSYTVEYSKYEYEYIYYTVYSMERLRVVNFINAGGGDPLCTLHRAEGLYSWVIHERFQCLVDDITLWFSGCSCGSLDWASVWIRWLGWSLRWLGQPGASLSRLYGSSLPDHCSDLLILDVQKRADVRGGVTVK